ncbi:MAG: hypothetical protein L0L69_09805, partial [Propionibacterium sp.]|nr:hypothetical protein [Propionibacterium sp.]
PGGHPEDFEVTSLQGLEDGELTRVVVDVAGEISNPWAGEGMTAQLLHIYLGVPEGTPPGTGAGRVECLPGTGAAARTAQPWQLALVASGLHRGPGEGTGLYDACAHLVSDVDLVVSRRQQIVLTLPTAALGGMDLPQARIFVLMADAVGDAREPGRSGGGFDQVALAALHPRVRCVPGLDLPAGGVAAGAHLVLPALTVEWVGQGS